MPKTPGPLRSQIGALQLSRRSPESRLLRTIVGMKAQDAERKLVQDRLQHRDQIPLVDFGRASHHFPLRHRVDCVDVVYPFATVLVALMHAAESTWSPARSAVDAPRRPWPVARNPSALARTCPVVLG